MTKKLLILAGSHFQVPVIKFARESGLYIITCDNRPENPGHKLSDKYYNVSTTDLNGVLEIARKEEIDGILAYGSDIAAPAAAYVSEKLGLIGNSFETVLRMTDKGKFRNFLSENGFPVPGFKVFTNLRDAGLFCDSLSSTLIIKPVDSSGSKGVTRVLSGGQICNAFNLSMEYSRKKEVIIEEEIQGKGPHIHGEAFVYKGDLKYFMLGDQYFSRVNSCAPLSTTLPSMYHKDIMKQIKDELTRLLSLLNFYTGGLNVEVIRGLNDKIYFIEIGPRNGGNLMPELAQLSTRFNLAEANVYALINDSLDFHLTDSDGNFCTQVILHSHKKGRFLKPEIPLRFSKYETQRLIYYKEGDIVNKYSSSQDVIGIILYKFSDPYVCRDLINYISNNNIVALN